MLTTDMNNLNYVAIEVIKSPGTKLSDVECGAFMGIVDYTSDSGVVTTFVVLQNTPKSVRMYNVSEYGIMTLQAETSEMKYMTVFTRTLEDQKSAVEILRKLITAMKDEKRMLAQTQGTDLINVDSYIDIPDSILSNNNLSASSATTTKNTGNTSNSSAYTGAGNYTNTTGYHTYKKPDPPKVLNFRRKGKLPATDKLTRMRQLVVDIANNTAVVKLPIPKCDLTDASENSEQEEHSSGGNSSTT